MALPTTAVVAALLFAFSAGTARASLESPAEKTVWDRLMEEQSSLSVRKGYALLNSRQYPMAAEEFLKAISSNPRDAGARVFYGASLYWLGEPLRALEEFDAALKIDPQNAMAFQLKGIVQAWQGDLRGALDNFTKADTISKNRADMKMNIGSVYGALGVYDKALHFSRQAVLLEPDNPLYRFQLGILYSRLGRYEAACAELKKALSIYPAYEDAMLELGVLRGRLGDYEAAVKLYRKALVLKPGDCVARFRLAAALLTMSGHGERKAGGELKKILEEAFLLTPKNDKGGISMTLAYGGGGSASAAKSAGPGTSPLENAVSKIPDDEDITVKFEVLELPKTSLVGAGREAAGSLNDGVPAPGKKPRVSYTKKEYFLAAGDSPARRQKAAAISAEIKAIMAAVSPANDARLTLNIETRKGAGAKSAKSAVSFRPRDVGNDMGLWVMGDNWIENVSDSLEEMESYGRAKSWEGNMVRGLGYLLIGRPDDALAEFDAALGQEAQLAYLGRAAAFVEKGDDFMALAACREALKSGPENKTVLSNIRWLSSGVPQPGPAASGEK